MIPGLQDRLMSDDSSNNDILHIAELVRTFLCLLLLFFHAIYYRFKRVHLVLDLMIRKA